MDIFPRDQTELRLKVAEGAVWWFSGDILTPKQMGQIVSLSHGINCSLILLE
jgi:hypothetical protein